MCIFFRTFGIQRIPEIQEQILKSFFSCKVEDLFCSVLIDDIIYGRLLEYRNCLRTEKKNATTPCFARPCQHLLKTQCLDAEQIVMKTIRASMRQMKPLLQQFPNFKIIHLIRDPRAMLRSVNSLGFGSWDDIGTNSKALCQRVIKDVQDSEVLEKEFPKRILRVRYEDLSRFPVDTAKQMFKFTGMTFTTDVHEYVQQAMVRDEAIQSTFHKVKPNSTIIMGKWRNEIKLEHVQTIDEACGAVYENIGYKAVDSSDSLRDHSVSLIVD